ncbi:hypothetical protein L7F22_048847 [Adiantum nelumboides]|nr:hypothetical protein [Adiantum nelumboides]
MDTGKTSRRKEKSVGHRSGTLDGHYKKDRGPDLKIACPIFKGKKHDDPEVHIQAFKQYSELKHIMEEEWGEYFPHTLKEAARKWCNHYPASKLQVYKKLKKAFILEYIDDRGDEDILCELDRIKQGKLSVRKYVQKIKELTRRLNEPPSEKRMRAWFLSGFNSRKLREQEVPALTKKFTVLVHRALKLEQQAKKEKSKHRGRSDTSTSETTKTEQSSSSSSESLEDDSKKKKKEFHLAKQVQLKEYLQANDMYSDMQRLAALYTGENDILINYFELMPDPPALLYAMRMEEAELPRFYPALYPPHTEPANQLTYIQIVEQIGDWWEKAEGLWKEWITVINEVEQKKTVKEFRTTVGEFKVGMRSWKRHMQVLVKHTNALLQLNIAASKILEKQIENLASNEDTYSEIGEILFEAKIKAN